MIHNASGPHQHLSRREFLRRSGLLGLGAFLGLPSCDVLFPPGPHLLFQQLDSNCAVALEDVVSLQGGRGRIGLSGVIITPNPCYVLQAELLVLRCDAQVRCPNAYEVAIRAEAQAGYCIECVGEISYKGEIRGLAPGSYTITVTYDGRRIAEEQVQVG